MDSLETRGLFIAFILSGILIWLIILHLQERRYLYGRDGRGFKKNDKVKLITRIYGDYLNNPVWNGKQGKIIGIISSTSSVTYGWLGAASRERQRARRFPYAVRWNNGSWNNYKKSDLEIITKMKKIIIIKEE